MHEAVHWHNVTPKYSVLSSSAPADMLHKYHVRIRGIDTVLPPERGTYKLGDTVCIKVPKDRGTTRFKVDCVTGVKCQWKLLEFHVTCVPSQNQIHPEMRAALRKVRG